MSLSVLDVVILLVLGLLVASRFFKFKLPRDERPRAERKGWREVVEKFQPAKKPAPDVKAATPADDGFVDVTPAKKQLNLRGKGRLVVPKGLTGLTALKAVDPAFDEAGFIKGAREAYSFFHSKWAAGDDAELAHLCAPRLLDAVADGELGKAPGKASEIKSVKIAGARLNGRTAIVEVEFEAKHGSKLLKSHWTLARAVGGLDPNWELQSFKNRQG